MINSYSLLKIFKSASVPSLILLPDAPKFTIIEVADSYLAATGRKESEIIGKSIFEIFAEREGVQETSDIINLRNSLHAVVGANTPNKAFKKKEGKYKSGKDFYDSENTPVLGEDGEVEYIIHSVIDFSSTDRRHNRHSVSEEFEIYSIKNNQEALINSTEDLIWSIDLKYKIISANKPYFNIIKSVIGITQKEGYPVLVEEYGEEVNRKWKAYYDRALKGEKFRVEDDAFNPFSNQVEHHLISIGPMINENGEVWGVACHSKDITKETQKLRALEKAKAELSKIMDSSLDVICTMDEEGRFVNISAAAEKVWGYAVNELIGQPYTDYVYEPDKIITRAAAAEIMQGAEMTNFENRYVRKDGTLIPMVWSARWDFQDKLTYCVAKDATEKKKSDLEMRLLINNTDEAFVLMDKNLSIISYNQKFAMLYEDAFGIEIQKGNSILDYAQPERKEITRSTYQKVLQGKEENAELPFSIKGEQKVFSLKYKPAQNEIGHIYGAFVTIKDVTAVNVAKQQIEASEKKYRLLFYNSPLPKWIFDLSTYKILEVNEAAIEHYGYSSDEFCQLSILEIRPKAEIPKVQNLLRGIDKNDGIIHFGVVSHQKKNGEIIKVEVSGFCMRHQDRDCMVVDCNDVTERESAFQQLKDSETKLLTAQNIAKLGYWQLEVEGNSVYWSDEVYNIWKVSKQNYEVSYDSFIASIHQEDRINFLKELENVLLGNKELDIEHRIILQDGSEKWVHEKGKLIYSDTCKPLVLEGTVQDITVEKLLELSLEESNKRYEYVTKATFDVIWDWDLITDKIYWGEGLQTIFGIDISTLKPDSSSWTDFIYAEDKERIIAEVGKVISGEEAYWINEYRYQKQDNTIAYVLDRGYVIRNSNGKAVRMVGALQDISKRKEEEYHLKLLESVITNSNDAVLILKPYSIDDLDFRIVYVNTAYATMMGCRTEEVMGKRPHVFSDQNIDDVKEAQIKNALKNSKPWEITSILYNNNKEKIWVDTIFSPIANEAGEIVHWIAIERDVTHRKNEELQKTLLAEVSQLFNQDFHLNNILHQVLERLMDYGGFCLAEIWLIGSGRKEISLSSYKTRTNDLEKFYRRTADVKSFDKGEGLPGIAWKEKKVQIWTDLANKNEFKRKPASETANFDTAYGMPLIYNDEVIGVLVLGFTHDEAQSTNLASLLQALSSHLGVEIRRKQLEQDLNQIFSFSPDIICIAGTDGYLRKINPAMCSLLEYSEEELLSIPFRNFIHPDDKENTKNEIYNLSLGKITSYLENRLISKSGKVIWLAWTAAPAEEESLFFSVAKDITEKKNLEQLLNKANELARIGSWEFDVKRNSLYWSTVTKEIHEVDDNFSPSSYKNIDHCKEGYSKSALKAALHKAMEDGSGWDLEIQIITAKGNERWVRSIGEVEFLNGKVVRIYGSMQDIDERKKTEAEILLSNERYGIAAKATNDSIWDWDLVKNEVVRPGKTLESLLGYENIPPEEVDNFWKQHVQKEDWERLTSHRNSLLEDPSENYWEDEYLFLKANGEYAHIYDRGYIVRDKDGNATRIIGAAVDISKLKENEIQLRAMNEKLEKQAKDLAISNSELEQFAYIASHDLQEPLRMITSFLTQIEKKYGEVLDEKGKKYIYFAVDGAKRMRQIILDLLEFSRVGRLDENAVEVDLNDIVNDVILLFRKRIKETHAKVVLHKMPVIKSYGSPLRQIFQNLISNAIKYHEKGSIPMITISSEERATHWEFYVEDNGIGIDSNYFNKIFIIFQRLHNKDDFSGTGIGLAIVKKIVESLGGEIWIVSEEGKGSRFYFTIAKQVK